jgi:hypothetical protein
MNSTLETFRVSDLRGGAVSSGGGATTLEDPTGRRRSLMRLLGRAVAVVLGLWLAALLFAGLGVGPVASIPFAQVLHPNAAPPALPTTLEPKPPTAADLKPALATQAKLVAPAVAPAPTVGKLPLATAKPPRGGTRTMPGKAAPHVVPVPGPSPTRTSHASPTGQAHGGSNKTTTTTTTTTPGRSGAAPGQSRLPGSASGR